MAIEDNGYFQEKLAEFNAKLAEFNNVLNAVMSADVSDEPQLQAEKTALVERAEWIKGAIQKTQDAINWANQQIRQLTDALSGNELGIAPIAVVAAIAAISGALAYMSSWISDAYAWSKKVEAAQIVKDAGGTPEEIARAIEGGDTGLGLGGSVLPLVLVGLGLFLWQRYNA